MRTSGPNEKCILDERNREFSLLDFNGYNTIRGGGRPILIIQPRNQLIDILKNGCLKGHTYFLVQMRNRNPRGVQ